jgi:hypothetical protein
MTFTEDQVLVILTMLMLAFLAGYVIGDKGASK